MAVQAPDQKRASGRGAESLRVEPSRGQARRPNVSWIVLGLVIVLASALGGAISIARAADRQPVLALGQPLERGEALTDEHLTTVHIAADEDMPLTPVAQRAELVGLVARTSLPAGTLVNREQFTNGPVVPAGWSVVGLALEPGEYPTAALRAGDRVAVVQTPDPNGPRSGLAQDTTVLSENSEVFAVEALSESTRAQMISISVPGDVAASIAAAAAEDRVRLVLVAPR